MKKKYKGIDAIKISFSESDLLTQSTSNCVLTTQLETTPGSSIPCDLTPEEFWQDEWWGNNEFLNGDL